MQTQKNIQESVEFVRDFLRLLEGTQLFGPLMEEALYHLHEIEESIKEPH